MTVLEIERIVKPAGKWVRVHFEAKVDRGWWTGWFGRPRVERMVSDSGIYWYSDSGHKTSHRALRRAKERLEAVEGRI